MSRNLLILLILAATLGWGCWGIFNKLALRSLHPALVQLVAVGVGLLTVPAYLLLFRASPKPLPAGYQGFAWAAAAGLMTWLASLTYLYAMERYDASSVSGYTSAYPVVTLVLAVLFLGESLTAGRALGIALIVLGVWLVGR